MIFINEVCRTFTGMSSRTLLSDYVWHGTPLANVSAMSAHKEWGLHILYFDLQTVNNFSDMAVIIISLAQHANTSKISNTNYYFATFD
jgi:hypothetical protein